MISLFDKKQLIYIIIFMIKTIRKIVFIIWVLAIFILAYYISHHREYLDPKNLLIFFQSFGTAAIIIYIGASFLRWLFLLPSLPLVFVGVLFFPNNQHLVFFVSMIGIIFSAVLIYKFSDIMWFDEIFAEHVHSAKIKNAIKRYWFYSVLIWSFVPVVPTDLICYVAGTVRMNIYKFIIALAIWEWLIVWIIVYGWNSAIKLLLL
jgi:uncharacterized membrane protein YdjX (TVP38/TMEM64 family)